MEPGNVKTWAYVIIVLTVGLFLGIAFMKINHAAHEPTAVNPQTQIDRLNTLENTPAGKSPAMRGFIQNERSRVTETHDVFDQTMGGQQSQPQH